MIIRDKFTDGWDLPGGRICKEEFNSPLPQVVKRKIAEELGSSIKYNLGEIKTTFRHERVEQGIDNNPTIRIFAVGYEARYLKGEIKLGDYIEEYKWININEPKLLKLLHGGWQEGVKEYLKNIS